MSSRYVRPAAALITVAASLSAVYCVLGVTRPVTSDSSFSLYDFWRVAHQATSGHAAHQRLVDFFWHVAPLLLASLGVAVAAAAVLTWLFVRDRRAERRLTLPARHRANPFAT